MYIFVDLKLSRILYLIKFMTKWKIFLFLQLTFHFLMGTCLKLLRLRFTFYNYLGMPVFAPKFLNDRNLHIIGKLLYQGYRNHKLLKTFKIFYRGSKEVYYSFKKDLEILKLHFISENN